MDVAFVHPGWPGGDGTGAFYSATRIASGLADQEHSVTVYCCEEPDKNPETNLKLRTLDIDRSAHNGIETNETLRNRTAEFEDFDVLHSYLPRTIPAVSDIGTSTGTATAVSLNAYGAVCAKNNLRYMERSACHDSGPLKCRACIAVSNIIDERYRSPLPLFLLRNYQIVKEVRRKLNAIDAFHALSPHVREQYADFGFPKERIHVAPNILDQQFLIEHRSDFEPPYRLLYVGQLRQHKGVEDLINLTAQLEPEDYRLTIVGDGAIRPKLEQLVKKQDVADMVTFTGYIDNKRLPEVYATHDLFVYLGKWDEPFGRVFLEALASGLPVVSSDVGNVWEIIGEGGVVIEGTVDSFVDTIRELAEERRLQSLSKEAKRSVEEYRANAVLPQIETIYHAARHRERESSIGSTANVT